MAVTESDHSPVGFYAARAPNAESLRSVVLLGRLGHDTQIVQFRAWQIRSRVGGIVGGAAWCLRRLPIISRCAPLLRAPALAHK